MVEAAAPDAAFARLVRLVGARGLPEVEPSTSHGAACLRVRTKVMVTLKNSSMLVLNCPIEQKALLMEISPEIYFETDHYIGWPAVLVNLDAIGDEELSLRLEDA